MTLRPILVFPSFLWPRQKDGKSAGEFLGFLFPDKSQGQQVEMVSFHPGYPTASWLCGSGSHLEVQAWGEKPNIPRMVERESGISLGPWYCPWAAGENVRVPTSTEFVVKQLVPLGFNVPTTVIYLTQASFSTGEGHSRGRKIPFLISPKLGKQSLGTTLAFHPESSKAHWSYFIRRMNLFHSCNLNSATNS